MRTRIDPSRTATARERAIVRRAERQAKRRATTTPATLRLLSVSTR